MKRKVFLLSLIALTLLVSGARAAPNAPELSWYIIGGGGGHVENGIYSLDSTIGQMVVGTTSNGVYDLCSGFWCQAIAFARTYLPLILR
jgi:hypothetical protein